MLRGTQLSVSAVVREVSGVALMYNMLAVALDIEGSESGWNRFGQLPIAKRFTLIRRV